MIARRRPRTALLASLAISLTGCNPQFDINLSLGGSSDTGDACYAPMPEEAKRWLCERATDSTQCSAGVFGEPAKGTEQLWPWLDRVSSLRDVLPECPSE